MGDIVGDLNRRRGQINAMDDRNGAKVVKASVPLSEMFGYVTTLRTLWISEVKGCNNWLKGYYVACW